MIASPTAIVARMMSLRLVDQQQARVLAHRRLCGIRIIVVVMQWLPIQLPFKSNGRGTSAGNARQLHVIVDIANGRRKRQGGEQWRL